MIIKRGKVILQNTASTKSDDIANCAEDSTLKLFRFCAYMLLCYNLLGYDKQVQSKEEISIAS